MTELRWADVTVERQGRKVLERFDLTVSGGRAVALIGPNGAGKSTALHAALGLIPTCAGRVEIDGRPVRRWSAKDRAARLSWLPQDAAPQEPLPAWEWVAAARYRFGERLPVARAAAERALAELGVETLGPRPVTALSGGQRQRVALAALFAQQADVLLADEPASHLDPGLQLETYARLGTQVRAGAGLVVVTHDVNLLDALGVAVEVVGLRDGAPFFRSPYPSDGLTDGLSALFGVPFASARVGRRELLFATLRPSLPGGAPNSRAEGAPGRPS